MTPTTDHRVRESWLRWSVGDRLRRARRYAGLTMEQIGRKLDPPVTRQAVSNYEHDITPATPRTIEVWAELCSVSASWIETGRGPAQLEAARVDRRTRPGRRSADVDVPRRNPAKRATRPYVLRHRRLNSPIPLRHPALRRAA